LVRIFWATLLGQDFKATMIESRVKRFLRAVLMTVCLVLFTSVKSTQMETLFQKNQPKRHFSCPIATISALTCRPGQHACLLTRFRQIKKCPVLRTALKKRFTLDSIIVALKSCPNKVAQKILTKLSKLQKRAKKNPALAKRISRKFARAHNIIRKSNKRGLRRNSKKSNRISQIVQKSKKSRQKNK